MQSENKHLRMGIGLQDLARRFQPVQAGHANIQDYYVRLHLLGLFDGLAAIRRFTADFPIGLRLQQRAQTLPDNFVIVSYENSKGCQDSPPRASAHPKHCFMRPATFRFCPQRAGVLQTPCII
jgi:hypothetical protein